VIRVYDEAGYAIETHGHKGRVQRVVSFEIMMEREKREKATFAKAFPEIEQCIVEVQETGHGVSGWIQDDVIKRIDSVASARARGKVAAGGSQKALLSATREEVRV
jgi:hypothetical protein